MKSGVITNSAFFYACSFDFLFLNCPPKKIPYYEKIYFISIIGINL